jgi:hypothetical protein
MNMEAVWIHIVYIISCFSWFMKRSLLIIPFSFQLLDVIAEQIDFNRDVRPILSQNCYVCHGPDKAHRKAKLRLDTEMHLKVNLLQGLPQRILKK